MLIFYIYCIFINFNILSFKELLQFHVIVILLISRNSYHRRQCFNISLSFSRL